MDSDHTQGRLGPISLTGSPPPLAQWPLVQGVGGALVAGSVVFNAVLALVNAHAFTLSNGLVSAVQGGIVFAAIALAALARPVGMARWITLLWALTVVFMLLSLLRERMEPRYLGDSMMIFAFIMLGMCLRARTMVIVLVGLQVTLCAFALWEVLSPAGFGSVFRVQSYYVSTRGLSTDSFWAKDSDLFISAQRPGGRLLLPGLAVGRASSLFLEPVSLGNWTAVVTIAIGALWRVLSRRAVAVLVAGNLFLVFACDGRLAMLLNALLLPCLILAPRVPRWVAPLTLPAMFLATLTADRLGLLAQSGDTFLGRLHYGLAYLLRLDVGAVLGVTKATGTVAADSGWAYLIITQSLVGAMLTWLAVTLPIGRDSPAIRRVVLGTAVMLAVAMPVSFSVFSIKTMGFLWALYGQAWAAGRAAGSAPASSSIVAQAWSQSAIPART